MNFVRCFVKKNAKAIVSVAVTAGTYAATKFGFDWTPDVAAFVAAAVGSVVVWFTKNTEC